MGRDKVMRKQIVIFGIIILLIIVGLSGCFENNQSNENNEKNRFVGTWMLPGNVVNLTDTYFSDGTFTENVGGSGTYDIKDGKLVKTYTNGNSRAYSYSFSNNDKTLTLTRVGSSYPEVYTKQ